MSCYPRGKEPTCPACGVNPLRDRASKVCGACAANRVSGAPPVAARGSSESVSVNGDACEVTRTTHEQVRTLADLIRVCEIDTAEWEVERYVCNKWEVGMRPAAVTEWVKVKGGRKVPMFTREEGDPITLPLYQVKAWLRRKTHLIDARAELAALKADAIIPPRAFPAIVRTPAVTGNVLELNLPDHHMGKLAWGKETGHDDYDLRIAERLFDDALDALIARTASYRFDRIWLVVGNDIIHADTAQGTTTSGTRLDTDGRYQKTFLTTRRMIVRAGERLVTVAPVEIVTVPGNHDQLSAWCLGDSLECWFHACSDVTVDNAPTLRKYRQWGSCMLMWTHGNKGKLERYPSLMASEAPEMWGATRYREAHTGDKHQRRLIEEHGVAVRILPSLTPPDFWHSENQFVGNIRCAEAYVWNRDEGLIGTAVYTVPRKQESEAA